MDRLTRIRKVLALLAVLAGLGYLAVRATHLGGAVAWLAWPLFAIEVWGFVHFAFVVQQLWPHTAPEVSQHSACDAFDVIVPVAAAATQMELNAVRASLVGAKASAGSRNLSVAWGSHLTAPATLEDLAAEFGAAFVKADTPGAAIRAAWAHGTTGVVAIVDPSYVLTADALKNASTLVDHECIAVVSCDEPNDAARFAITNAGAGGSASIPRGISLIRRTLCDAVGGIQGRGAWREQTTLSFVRSGYSIRVAGDALGASLAAESIAQAQLRAIERVRNSMAALVQHGSPLRSRGFGVSRRITMIGRLVAPLDGLRQAALLTIGTAIAVIGRLPIKMNALLLVGAFVPWVVLSGIAIPALTGFVSKPGDRTRDAMRRVGVVFGAIGGVRRKAAFATDMGGVKALKSQRTLVGFVIALDLAMIVRGVAQKASIGLHRLPNAPLGMMLAIMGFQIMMALDVLQMVVRRRQRRTTNRTAVRMSATFEGKSAVAVDVTPSGLGIMTYGEFAPGTTVTVGLILGGVPIEVGGVVRSIVPQNAPTDSLIRVGVELTTVAAAAFDKLVLFCHGGLDSAAVRYTPKPVAQGAGVKAPKGQLAQRPGLRAASIFAFLGIATAMAPPYYGASAAVTTGGTIGGVVFQDFNANGKLDTTTKAGAVDVGIGGVTLKITCVKDTGPDNIVGTADDVAADPITTVTKSDVATLGQWAIVTTSLPCRVEIDQTQAALTGFQEGAHGTGVGQAGSSVQFISTATTSLNFGFNKPNDFCQDNPKLVENCFVYGDQVKGVSAKLSVLKNFNYGAYGSLFSANNTENPVNMANAADIGTTFGLAYNRVTKTVYASAMHKVYAGFGPGGPGAIYGISATSDTANSTTVTTVTSAPAASANGVANSNGAAANSATKTVTTTTNVPAATVFATIPEAGTDARSAFVPNVDLTAGVWIADPTWDTVGKSSLGDIEISEDGSTLWVVNLNNRKLYPVDLVTKPGAVGTPVAIPLAAGAAVTCAASDVRPYGLGQKAGLIYVGEVCSAQSTAKAADLRMYVYTFDPKALTFSAKPVFESSLVFKRGQPGNGCGVGGVTAGDWHPWATTDTYAVKSGSACANTQPILSDIVFDNNDMILGFRDRFGDQASEDHPLGHEGVSAGDILRACGNPAAGWKLEANATCGTITTKGAGNNQGPGSAAVGTAAVTYGEYYYNEQFSGNHGETSMGGLAQIPGFPDVLNTVFDPNYGNGNDWRAGGLAWESNATGYTSNWYQLFDKCDSSGLSCPAGRTRIGTFGKVNGVGDVVALCDMAPIEFGDRVWVDGNNNGLQDAGEKPLAGVAVSLYAADGATLLDSAITDANGLYLFSNDTRFAATGAFRYGVTKLVNNTDYVIRIANSQGPSQQAALKGYSPATPNQGANLAGISDLDKTKDGALIHGENATIDSDGLLDDSATSVNARVKSGTYGVNNHNIDFGYVSGFSLGNFVWDDVNNNGIADAGEPGIDGVTVNLYADADANGVPDGAALQTQLTSSGGYYLFTNLSAFTYIVEVVNPAGMVSSTGTPGSATGPNELGTTSGTWVAPTVLTDGLDRGNTTGTTTRSKPIPLNGIALQPTKEPVTPGHPDLVGTPDERTNYTADFGFITPLSVGSVVFADANKNGVKDIGEAGIGGIAVRLLSGDGNVLAKTVTDANGLYIFTYLNQGKFMVETDLPAGYSASTSSRSAVFAVTRGGAPAGLPKTLPAGVTDPAPATSAYYNVNFGYLKPVTIGNFVWDDLNDNGVQDVGEPGLAKVSVQLTDVGPDGKQGTTDDKVISQSTTDDKGYYSFAGLPNGVYFVTVTTPPGYRSSTGGNNDPNDNVNTDDNGPDANTGDIRSLPLKVVAGSAPINDGDTDANTNLTLDFGMFRPTASITLKAYTNGCDAQKGTGVTGPTGACPKDDGVNNPVVAVGSGVEWTYIVTNTGTVPLGKVVVTDKQLGAGGVSCPASELKAGASMTCSAKGKAIPGQYENSATVTAAGETTATKVVALETKAEHTDLSHYFGGAAKLSIRTYTNIADPNGGKNLVADDRADAQSAGGADPSLNYVVPVGSPVFWAYVVKNEGNVDVKSLAVTDDVIGAITCPVTSIAAGQSVTCVGKGTLSKVGQYTNYGSATAVDPLSGATISATKDPTNSFAFSAAVTLTKLTNGCDANKATGADGATNCPKDDGTKNPVVDAGSTVTWTYVVKNTGNISIGGLAVTDDKIKQDQIDCNGAVAGNGQPIPVIAPASSVTCVATGIATKGQYTNNGLVTGVATDAKGNKVSDTGGSAVGVKAADASNYFGRVATVGDFVWNDTNANGIQDAGESGIPEVKVDLYDVSTNKVVASVGTDKDGRYSLANVVPGKYFLVFTVPSGWNISDPNQSKDLKLGTTIDSDPYTQFDPKLGQWRTANFALAGGQNDTSWDAGMWRAASFGDQVFWDKNHNGIYEPKGVKGGGDDNETGVAGVTVKLFDSRGVEVKIGADGILGTKDDAPGGVVTDANGHYQFTNLTPNTYSVQFLPGASWKYSPAYATNEEQDSNADPQSGQTKNFTLTSGQNNATIDAGIFHDSSIGDRVWADLNGNGIQDANEPGIASVRVEIWTAGKDGKLSTDDDQLVGLTQTNSKGDYLFNDFNVDGGVVSGQSYDVRVPSDSVTAMQAPLVGLLPTQAFATDDTKRDSNGQPQGLTSIAHVTAPIEGFDQTFDFGFRPAMSIGDLVWNDVNNNGVADKGEPGIPGVLVYLYHDNDRNGVPDGGPIDKRLTNDAGYYQFTDLLPGSYIVEIPQSDPLKGLISSTGANGRTDGPYEGDNVPSPDNFVDGVDHGYVFKDVVRSKTVNLDPPATWPLDPNMGLEIAARAPQQEFAAMAVAFVEGDSVQKVREVQKKANEEEKISILAKAEPAQSAIEDPVYHPIDPTKIGVKSSGLTNQTVDFGFFRPLFVGNLVWIDANNDGIFNEKEKPLPEVYVHLYTEKGELVASTNTDGEGHYRFDNLAPGRYYVAIDTPDGLVSSTGATAKATGPFEPAPSIDQLPDDNVDRGTNADKQIVSQVFLLNHADVIVSQEKVRYVEGAKAEKKLSNEQLDILQKQIDSWDDSRVKYLMEKFGMNEDEARKYLEQLREKLLKEIEYLRQNGGDQSAVAAVAADASERQGAEKQAAEKQVVEIESLPAGVGSLDNIDFGVTPRVSIGDTVWSDLNNNGVHDDGEPGVSNVQVTLAKTDGTVVATTTTDEKGNYLFGSLPQDTYNVSIGVPAGMRVSSGTSAKTDVKLSADDATVDFGLFTPHAGITLKKYTNGCDAQKATGDAGPTADCGKDDGMNNPRIPVGANVTWTYVVHNTGNAPLSKVAVTDDQKGVAVTCPGDALGVGASMTCTASGKAIAGQYGNTGSVTATGEIAAGKVNSLSDTKAMHDESHYFGYQASMTIKKYTNVTDPGSGKGSTTETDDAQAPGGINAKANHIVPLGSTVWWLYNVSNTGNSTLGHISVSDSKEGGVKCPSDTLAAGASMTCVKSGTLTGAGQYTNDAVVAADNTIDNTKLATVSDPSNVFVADPKLSMHKLTNDRSDNPNVDAGSVVKWSYQVKNTGNVPLAKVAVTDDKVAQDSIDCNGNAPGTGNPVALLPVGESITCYASGTATKGQYKNLGTGSGTPVDDGGTALTTTAGKPMGAVTASESSSYVGEVASIGDYVWHDQNANGIQDGDEKPMAKVVVNLLGSDGKTLATTTTNDKGHYQFVDLSPGTYRVQFIAPEGWRITTKGAGNKPTLDSNPMPANGITDSTVLSPNENDTSFDAGMYQPASIGGYAWDDRNRDGLQMPLGADGIDGSGDDEPGIPGVAVYLLDSEGTAIAKTKTDDKGRYLFSGLVPGKYSVAFSQPVGWLFAPAGAAAANLDSNADQATGHTSTSIISSGQVDDTIDAGMYQQLTLGDRVWVDLNNDGINNGKEPGLAGVAVQLWNAGGDGVVGSSDDKLVGTTTTNEKGDYQFNDDNTKGGILPGVRMSIRIGDLAGETQQKALAGLVPALANARHDDLVDSDGVHGDGVVIDAFTTGQPNTNDVTHDFGFTPTYQLGNLVFNDVNNNGVFDEKAGEKGIDGVTVLLYADSDHNGVPDGDPVAKQVTTQGGHYLFSGLTSSGYVVSVVTTDGPVQMMLSSTGVNGDISGPFEPAPSPMKNASDNQDKGTQTKSDVRSGTVDLGPIETWSAESGDDPRANATVDFGFYTPYETGNLVWNDANNNGVVDKGETGIAKVQVRLMQAGPDAKPGTGDDVKVASVFTDDKGNYQFTRLSAGEYYTEIDAQPGLATSSGANGLAVGPYEPAPALTVDTIDSADRGTAVGDVIRSSVFPVEVAAADRNRVDFGLYAAVSVGNFVWNDTNNNGVFDSATEKGMPGVEVRAYVGDQLVNSTTTNADGYYHFSGLRPDDYQIEITMPDGYRSSADVNTSADPNNDVNSDDNGIGTGGGKVRSGTVTLTVGGEPIADGDNDSSSNLSVDFGIFAPKASMTITKTTNGVDNLTVASGAAITWSYTVANTGNVPLYKVVVTDDHSDVSVKCPASDLAIGDSMTCTATGIAVAGAYANVGTVNAFGETIPGVTGRALKAVSDASNYFGTAPGLSVKKYTNVGADLSGSALSFGAADDADVPGGNDPTVGHVVPVGTAVTWVYVVKNTGNIPLDTLLVTDNDPGLLIKCAATTLAANDNAANGPDETVCTASGVLKTPGQYVNVGIASAADNTTTPGTSIAQSASDPSSVFVAQPKVSIRKFTQTHDSAGDATTGDGASLALGGKVTWLYDVANDGNTALIDVAVADDVEKNVVCPQTTLLPKQSMQCEAHGVVKLGKYVNNGTVTAAPADDSLKALAAPGAKLMDKVNATDRSAYVGVGASVGDRVWLDLNANGKQDNGEPGLKSVTVNLLDEGGKVVRTTTTDDSGAYGFVDVPPARYSVEFVAPDGYLMSSPLTNDPFDLAMGDKLLTVDAGMYKLARLGDRVWYDRNGNGVQNDGEKGLKKIPVSLLDSHGDTVGTTTTDDNGDYVFEKLKPGSYVVVVEKPDGYKSSPKHVGNDPKLDSDFDKVTHQSNAIVLNSGDSDTTVDAGFYLTISIGDVLWIDNNHNGERDPREPLAQGVTVVLYDEFHNEVGRMDTGADGAYLFNDLIPGRYALDFLNLPPGETPSDGGGDPGSTTTTTQASTTVPVEESTLSVVQSSTTVVVSATTATDATTTVPVSTTTTAKESSTTASSSTSTPSTSTSTSTSSSSSSTTQPTTTTASTTTTTTLPTTTTSTTTTQPTTTTASTTATSSTSTSTTTSTTTTSTTTTKPTTTTTGNETTSTTGVGSTTTASVASSSAPVSSTTAGPETLSTTVGGVIEVLDASTVKSPHIGILPPELPAGAANNASVLGNEVQHSASKSLASTGSNAISLAVCGLALIAGGGLLMGATSRRRRRA